MRFALSGADSQHIERADILAYPGVVFDVSERTETETSAQLDLDGDGVPEKISLHPAEPVTGYSLEQYTIYLNLGLSQMNCYDLQDAVLEIDGQTAEIPDSTGSKVRMTKLDATQDWICIEITDGVKGWFRLRDGTDYSDYFSGLYFAG